MSTRFPDPDMFRADVAHWQRFLKSRGLYRGDVNGRFDSLTKEASFEFQRQRKLHEKEPVDDVVLRAARSLGYEIPQRNPPWEYFDFKKGERIELSVSERHTLKSLAYLYYLWTGKRITLNSGTRTAREQASAMYNNWYNRLNPGTHYKDKEAERDIRKAYESSVAAGRGREATIDAITSVIENQVSHQRYLSPHLTRHAVDVRTRDMSASDKAIFDSLRKHFTVDMLREQDHFHLQLP